MAKMSTLAQCAAGLERIVEPVWVFHAARQRIVWANDAAVHLWSAADRAELLARDLSDISEAMKSRIDHVQAEICQGRPMTQQVTFYPKGRPITLNVHLSGIGLDGGAVGMLTQAISPARHTDTELVRGIEAIRHSRMLVALVDASGAILMRNPASMRAFGEAPYADWFVDAASGAALLSGAIDKGSALKELVARTTAGERVHRVEAHRVVDPVTGKPALLIHQLDETARRMAEQESHAKSLVVAQQRDEILALSAPVIEVGAHALAVPITGELDEALSRAIMQRLLPAIAGRGATDLILDLTGARRLDEASAGALAAVTRAVRLLGARVIVTGIRPEAAQVLASTGAGLDGAVVKRTLRDALALVSGA